MVESREVKDLNPLNRGLYDAFNQLGSNPSVSCKTDGPIICLPTLRPAGAPAVKAPENK